MGKTQTPLKILIVGPSSSQLFQDKKIQSLLNKGDNVEILEAEADCIIGETAYRTFPKTVKFTLAALEGFRKAKAKVKAVKDEGGSKVKKGKGKGKAAKSKKSAKSPSPKVGVLPKQESCCGGF